MVMYLSFIMYYVTIPQAVFGILRLLHILPTGSYFFQVEANERKASHVYLCVSLINQVFVLRYFTVLHRLAQSCFTRVVLDSGHSRK